MKNSFCNHGFRVVRFNQKVQKMCFCRYKWRSVPCNETHFVMCSFRKPPCPDGFTWGHNSNVGSTKYSCLHVPERKIFSEFKEDTIKTFHQSKWTFNDYCAHFGAYLARPRKVKDFETILDWINKTTLYNVSNAFSQKYSRSLSIILNSGEL